MWNRSGKCFSMRQKCIFKPLVCMITYLSILHNGSDGTGPGRLRGMSSSVEAGGRVPKESSGSWQGRAVSLLIKNTVAVTVDTVS